jgi:hypothetical protein
MWSYELTSGAIYAEASRSSSICENRWAACNLALGVVENEVYLKVNCYIAIEHGPYMMVIYQRWWFSIVFCMFTTNIPQKKHPFKLENDHKPLDFEVPSQTNPYIWESKQQSLWSASKCWENWLANVGILDFPTKQNNPSGSKYLRRKYDWGMIWGVKYPLRQYLDP